MLSNRDHCLVLKMFDYTIFYKNELSVDEEWPYEEWDIFISAYNSSDRVNKVFDKVKSPNKYWLILPDYNYSREEYPTNGTVITYDTLNENEYIKKFIENTGINKSSSNRICIDITGFIKPCMMVILRWLMHYCYKKVDIIYSEPNLYSNKEKTKFSDEEVSDVRHITGYSGMHDTDVSNDILILNSGYDDELISFVAEYKSNTRKVQVYGFPSLRPDMYQENILNAYRASESIDTDIRDSRNVLFAPANDPFVTATVLSKFVSEEDKKEKITNIYLSPLATKPQALGFTLYYLRECINQPVSIIYPYCESHARETSIGLSRVWKYSVEL